MFTRYFPTVCSSHCSHFVLFNFRRHPMQTIMETRTSLPNGSHAPDVDRLLMLRLRCTVHSTHTENWSIWRRVSSVCGCFRTACCRDDLSCGCRPTRFQRVTCRRRASCCCRTISVDQHHGSSHRPRRRAAAFS